MRYKRHLRFFSLTVATHALAISVTRAFAITFPWTSTRKLFPRLSSSVSNDSPGSQRIKDALLNDYPEIEIVHSDAYLESVASAPNRTLENAIAKIKRNLEWRRLYQVEPLLQAFEPKTQNDTRIFVPRQGVTFQNSTQQLVDVCASRAFFLKDRELVMDNGDRRLVVHADTSKLNWWKTGVTAGLRYHVLVLEDAFSRIARENRNRKGARLQQSLILCVDTTAPPLLPPPMGTLRGFIHLMRTAYPDRIYRVCVGPVSPFIRGIYSKGVKPFLKPKMQQKIVLLGENPSNVLKGWSDGEEKRSSQFPVSIDKSNSIHHLLTRKRIRKASISPKRIVRSQLAMSTKTIGRHSKLRILASWAWNSIQINPDFLSSFWPSRSTKNKEDES